MSNSQVQAYSAAARPFFDLAVVLSASLLLAFAAKIQIPFYPVPMTMQTFVVLGISLVLGPIRGALSVLAYLAAGIAGLPVFAGSPELGIGVGYVMGPTGGYLLGFLPAVLISGGLVRLRRDKSLFLIVGALIAALATIYASGLLWLGSVIGFEKPLLRVGFFPFVLGDLTKAAIVAITFYSVRSWLEKRGEV